MIKRRHPRFIKRLQLKFCSGGISFTGLSGNLSEGGIFIRTRNSFSPDTIIDIELSMPDGKKSFLRGLVKRAVKIPASSYKNGMGVELIERDNTYSNFLKFLSGVTETRAGNIDIQEFQIISCPNCGVKHKVWCTKLSMRPRCVRCRSPLISFA